MIIVNTALKSVLALLPTSRIPNSGYSDSRLSTCSPRRSPAASTDDKATRQPVLDTSGQQLCVSRLLLNPKDSLSVWSTDAVTTGNQSYAMLEITTNANDAGRQAEWKDNANGAAVLITDRNIGTDNTDSNATERWTTAPGDWRAASPGVTTTSELSSPTG